MTITLSENFRALFYAPFYAAHATGAYRAAGVDVALEFSKDPAAASRALRGGRIDVMWGGPLRVLQTHDTDPAADLVCFCDVVARDPFFVIGASPAPAFAVEDLMGLRFASVSEVPTPWLCLQDDLRRAGVDPASVDRVSGGTMPDNVAALQRGDLDAIQVFQPYAEQLIASGTGHLWHAAADRGLTAYTTLVTRREVLDSRPDELLAMARAMLQTLRWVAATPGAEIARTLAGYFPDAEPAIVAAAIDRYKALGLWSADPVLRREGFDRLKAAMISGGALSRDIPFETCVDNRLAERAVAEAPPV
jgi:NitT/TauT family transport system substrate-binding protein